MKKNVTEYIENTVRRFPDKTAIVARDSSITFKELRDKARLVAGFLAGAGIGHSPVAVLLPKGINAIVCFLASGYSSNFYVPLDVKSPVTRIDSILSVLDSDFVVTDRKHMTLALELNAERVFVVEDILEGADSWVVGSPVGGTIDTDPVYCIFTSGSTGNPKGVVISHRSVIDYIDWAIETFDITEHEVIGNQAPFYFDNSVLDIYLMYATGATLVLVPESYYIFPVKLVRYLNEQRVSFIFWVPFVLINVANFDILRDNPLVYIRKVLFAGEVMPNKHLNYWRKYLPNSLFANLYGPTEITVDCTCYIVDRTFDDADPLPIGFPCRNSDVIILNEFNERVKDGETGELCVRGSSLALGYYGDWEKTGMCFVQNPLNKSYPERIYRTGDLVYVNDRGEIMFVGRKDFQIKHNGYRIELGEIENAAFATRMIDNACSVYDEVNKRIVLFFESGDFVDIKELRLELLKYIPRYMMPGCFIRLEKMAVNANGKIDRKSLKREVNRL